MTVSRWWDQRSSPQRLDLYIRWSLYFTSVTIPIAVLPGTFMGAMSTADGNLPGLAAFGLVVVAQTVACIALLRAGLRTLLGGPPPRRWLIAVGSVLTVAGLATGARAFPNPTPADVSLIVLIAPFLGGTLTAALTPVLSRRAMYAGIGLGAAATICWYAVTVVDDWPFQLVPGLVYTLLVGVFVVIYRSSEWMLVLVWELDESRAVQARLAVAEERLRFARDFHDVLGRNLTLIAVTSDLAAQLAGRGDPQAVDRMLDVRRIAHESAREVREVVSGYRAADLDAELAGARSVLRAAGIGTRVIGDSGGVSGDAQVAFAWVLREATTNVIRHSRASTCTIELGIQPAFGAGDDGCAAVLRVRNDGVSFPDPQHAGGHGPAGPGLAGPGLAGLGLAGPGLVGHGLVGHGPAGNGLGGPGLAGHGLAGLGERVTALGGQFTAGAEPGGWFTVEARLPVTEYAPVAAVKSTS